MSYSSKFAFLLIILIIVSCNKEKNNDDSIVNIVAVMKSKKGKSIDLRNALLSLVKPTRKEEGFISYDVHESKDSTLFLYEKWRSQEDLNLHLKKPYIKDFVRKLDTLLQGKNDAHFGKLISNPNTNRKIEDLSKAVFIASIKKPKAGMRSALRESLLALVEPTHSEDGCITYDIYEEKDGSIFLYEVWSSQEDLNKHFEKTYVKAFRSKAKDLAEVNIVHFGKRISDN